MHFIYTSGFMLGCSRNPATITTRIIPRIWGSHFAPSAKVGQWQWPVATVPHHNVASLAPPMLETRMPARWGWVIFCRVFFSQRKSFMNGGGDGNLVFFSSKINGWNLNIPSNWIRKIPSFKPPPLGCHINFEWKIFETPKDWYSYGTLISPKFQAK